MKTYGRGEITSSPIDWDTYARTGVVPEPSPYTVTAADGTVTTVPYAGDDPYGDALAALGLARPYRACLPLATLRESWDADDPWGSAMHAAFAVCDLMAIIGAPVPDVMGYRPAGLPTLSDLIGATHDDADLTDLARLYVGGEITALDLTRAALILHRYIDAADAAGRSY